MNVAHLNPKALLLREWLRDYELLLHAQKQYAELTDESPRWMHHKRASEVETAQWRVAHFETKLPADLIAAIKVFVG